MTHSESIANIAAAMVRVQSQIEPAENNSYNEYFRYSYPDLDALWTVARPLLAEEGIAVIQGNRVPDVSLAPDGLIVITTLLHVSGEWIQSEIYVPALKKKKKKNRQGEEFEEPEESGPAQKPDAQAFGAANSYARRIAFQAALGITPADDDGEGERRQPSDRPGQNGRPVTPMSLEQARKDLAMHTSMQAATKWFNAHNKAIVASPEKNAIMTAYQERLREFKNAGK